jgi:hypothetical protein
MRKSWTHISVVPFSISKKSRFDYGYPQKKPHMFDFAVIGRTHIIYQIDSSLWN